jgi:hypothetical protein
MQFFVQPSLGSIYLDEFGERSMMAIKHRRLPMMAPHLAASATGLLMIHSRGWCFWSMVAEFLENAMVVECHSGTDGTQGESWLKNWCEEG